jgi:hypothetical protein
MQISRNLQLIFPPDSAASGSAKPVGTAVPAAAPAPVAPKARESQSSSTEGVIVKLQSSDPSLQDPTRTDPTVYTKRPAHTASHADLRNMTLANQLEFGRDQGVFTKITLHKDGALEAKAQADQAASPPEFVTSAVTTMRDYAEGLALLKQSSPDATNKTGDFLAGKFRSLQQLTAKLNVFA